MNPCVDTEARIAWARSQVEQANAFRAARKKGDPPSPLPTELYSAALTVLSEHEHPLEWATIQVELADIESEDWDGDVDCLTRIIDRYEAATRVFTETEHSFVWAEIQIKLGATYREASRRLDDPAVGLPWADRSSVHYNAALRIYTEDEFPGKWAEVLDDIAWGYYVDTSDENDRPDLLQEAITLWEAASSGYEQAGCAHLRGKAMLHLTTAYRQLQTGDKAANVRLAMARTDTALAIWPETESPYMWALTQSYQGENYLALPDGDRGENVRAAIAFFEACLRYTQEKTHYMHWGTVKKSLGVAFCELPDGDRAANLRQAISHFEDALRQLPWPFSTETMNLAGQAYRQLPDGDREANLKAAIRHFEAAVRWYAENSDTADDSEGASDGPRDPESEEPWGLADIEANLAAARSELETETRNRKSGFPS